MKMGNRKKERKIIITIFFSKEEKTKKIYIFLIFLYKECINKKLSKKQILKNKIIIN